MRPCRERGAGVYRCGKKAGALQIASNCERVPAKGAQLPGSLPELLVHPAALQMESSGHSISPGRFDQYMYPYYKKDLDEGRITRDQAPGTG